LFTGVLELLRCAVRRPFGTFVLAADFWLRPRILLLGALALLSGASDVLMVVFSTNGAWTFLAAGGGGAAAGSARPIALLVCLLLLSLDGKSTLAFEWLSIAALRHRIGYPAECPPVSAADLSDSFLVWLRAAARGLAEPGRWHRARPGA
ncbi:MAG TPA: hypothetical protein VMN04_04825, partial [Thermoanaerobaculia bacterium]|nr:hypothetical protein [Thermoanaerobaculia bacterium]